jgi:hypothetical protein
VVPGLPPPCKVLLAAMPTPDIPFQQRPWRQQHLLNDAQFKVTALATS